MRSRIGFRSVSREIAGLQRPGVFWRLVFLTKPDARLEKGLRGFCAIALMSVFSKWYTTVLVAVLHEEKEPIEWVSLHVRAERCEL